jgi:tetratricopeptide (TPR) repeat protein
MKSGYHAIVLLAFLLALPATLVRGGGEPWVGKRVLGKKESIELLALAKPDAKVVGKAKDALLSVEGEDGAWIRVRSSGLTGWIAKVDAVLLDDAVRYFSERIRLDEKDAPAYEGRALAWVERGEYDRALNDLDAAMRLDTKSVSAVRRRGGCWLAKGEYEKALRDFDEALRLDPKNARAFNNRGTLWAFKMEWDKAIIDFDEAIRLDPSDVTGHSNRGACFVHKEQFDRAIRDYDEVIRCDETDSNAFAWRASCWYLKKDYQKAIADFSAAVRLNSKDRSVYQRYAWLLATCPDRTYRDGKKAVELAKKACDLSEWKDPQDLNVFSESLAESGDFKNAIKYQWKALEHPEYENEYGPGARERIKELEEGKAYNRQ